MWHNRLFKTFFTQQNHGQFFCLYCSIIFHLTLFGHSLSERYQIASNSSNKLHPSNSITKKTMIKILIHILQKCEIFSGIYTPENEIGVSQGSLILNLTKNCQVTLHYNCIFLLVVYKSSSFTTPLPTLGIIQLSDFHSQLCINWYLV